MLSSDISSPMPHNLVGDLVIDFFNNRLDMFRDFTFGFVVGNFGKVKTQLSSGLFLCPTVKFAPTLELGCYHVVLDISCV